MSRQVAPLERTFRNKLLLPTRTFRRELKRFDEIPVEPLACLDIPFLNALFANVDQACPTCTPASQSVVNSGLDGLFSMDGGLGEWNGSNSDAAYDQYNDVGCASLFGHLTGQALIIRVTCGGEGLHVVTANVQSAEGGMDVFLANNVLLGVEAPNELSCGGTVVLSEP